MKLSIGIVGLPNVGKSSLFKALTKNDIVVANYPFATIDPNVGIVQVPDERLDKLAEMSKSAKKIPAIVEFYDIAGLVKGASQGQGLGNQFLTHIRETNAIAHVVRCFQNDSIIHVDNSVQPIRDIETIETELILKDMETVEKRLTKAESDARNGDKIQIALRDALKEIKQQLNSGIPLFTTQEEHPDKLENVGVLKELGLLTAKPQLFVLNGREEDITDELRMKIKDLKGDYVVADLSSPTPNLSPLITHAYSLLNLISFLTTGEDETRAWTIIDGWKAPQAAGTIHTDFEHKFIRADVVNWKDLLTAGSWVSAKQKGLIRTEGKEYVVKDGDVIEIKHG
ncbi:redox-regulated ATPase YchF [Candidatus Wolfebacteria bacterium RIFCSPHIGHO2_01_FULL_48_22]|uniref:Ribosome-binding ATPase YchF n=2 Tax=Candidatus Wolfeibacteriota TaxID=1752735 RepID=A0A1F8DSU8_9BACT|nr:MAG: redox-regulated ATPase YchF [Candidatus Wolfebacteria bacterium RIFCSPHIGHO2_01_FULL_48_22]OGM91956.1 MAG: redox-regulated ATPase YchF [Candidatus Wolfebacteria bacterium RIFCSPLOWO2_01_FULL_47_17b]